MTNDISYLVEPIMPKSGELITVPNLEELGDMYSDFLLSAKQHYFCVEGEFGLGLNKDYVDAIIAKVEVKKGIKQYQDKCRRANEKKDYKELYKQSRKLLILLNAEVKPGHKQDEEVLRFVAAIMNNAGFSLMQSGNLDLAEKYLLRAKELDPKQDFVNNNLGDVYRAKGDNAKAIESYKAELVVNPKHPYARKSLDDAKQSRISM